ncbi:hypothetical protein MC885_018218 [Smutsia gigantea]|nr:hypothetical protein MC885_018218 [Smutsia gigantea]
MPSPALGPRSLAPGPEVQRGEGSSGNSAPAFLCTCPVASRLAHYFLLRLPTGQATHSPCPSNAPSYH